MSQADTTQMPAADAQPLSQGDAGQINAQPAVQPAPQDDGFVRVQAQDLEAHGYGRDFSKALHDAKQYREYQKNGFDHLSETLESNGLTAFEIDQWLKQQAQEGAAQQPQGQPDPSTQYGQQQGQQGYQTPDEIQALVDRRLTQFRDEQAQQQALQQGRAAEKSYIEEAMKSLGVKGEPMQLDEFGNQQVDPVQEYIVKPAISQAIDRELAKSLNPKDPQYQMKMAAPAPRDVVQRAAKSIEPFLKGIMQQAAEALAQTQATMPPTTLTGAGPTGRPQTNPQDMTPEQRKAEVVRRAKANPLWSEPGG